MCAEVGKNLRITTLCGRRYAKESGHLQGQRPLQILLEMEEASESFTGD